MNTVWYDYNKVETKNGTAVAIGNFDGLHKGHMKLLSMLMDVSQDNGIHSVAYTFDKHPVNVLKGENTLKLIADNEYKQELLSTCNLDTLFFDNFEAVKDLSPADFVRDILVEKLNMKVCVVGLHNHYGKDSEGDVKLLRELGQKYGFLVLMIKPLYVSDYVCSSTKIRALIEEGDVDSAKNLLGRPFKVRVNVDNQPLTATEDAKQVDITLPTGQLLPKSGVYEAVVHIDGAGYQGYAKVSDDNTVSAFAKGCENSKAKKTVAVEFIALK